MKLIVGLGNPGNEYEKTRHNVGYMAVNKLAELFEAENFKEDKHKAHTTSTEFNNEKLILAKPTTFMNLSGEAVSKIMNFYKISPEDVWIIYDDIDLPLGQIRVRKDGGAGTHKGMKSIIENIGNNFPRFRVGIESRGASAPSQQDISSFVLNPFTKEEEPIVKETVEKTAEAVKTALEEGIESAMNKFNS